MTIPQGSASYELIANDPRNHPLSAVSLHTLSSNVVMRSNKVKDLQWDQTTDDCGYALSFSPTNPIRTGAACCCFFC